MQAKSEMQCRACANSLRPTARFCDACGRPVSPHTQSERKQVTVLFADVVGSMALASAIDPERLREIMGQFFARAAVVVTRYGGTVDKFTGDGLMALFGAPAALEDHALRAGLAALGLHSAATDLPIEIRVGLNSGEVITGDIRAGEYTAVGHHVGLAQRMESTAAPGSVMCTETTARLIGSRGIFGPVSDIVVKGSKRPVAACELRGIRSDSPTDLDTGAFVGRHAELRTLVDLWRDADQSVFAVVGEPGTGKSRLLREFLTAASHLGGDPVVISCESHMSDVPLHAVTRLLRAALGVHGLDAALAREQVATHLAGSGLDNGDIEILFNLLSLGDRAIGLTPDVPARRGLLSEALRATTRIGSRRTLFVVEDVHWIDQVSEEVLVELIAKLDESNAVLVTTFRPGYNGALRDSAHRTVPLTPLDRSSALLLVEDIIGSHPSATGLAEKITEPAAGNPFFIEEIVADLVDRGLLVGRRADYRLTGPVTSIPVPSSVQSVIAARIDRFGTDDKAILHTGAVIGSSFDENILREMLPDSDFSGLRRLVASDLIHRTRSSPIRRYAFRHPLVRAVCYDTQLSSVRAERHRNLALLLESRSAGAVTAEAPVIAFHLNAAGSTADAYAWYLRAADWLHHRDLRAARTCWRSASAVADTLPDDVPDRDRKRAVPRGLLAMTDWMAVGVDVGDQSLDELRTLTPTSGSTVPLAMALTGRVTSLVITDGRPKAAVALAAELLNVYDTMDETATDERREALMAATFANYSACDFATAMAIAERMRSVPASTRADDIAPPLGITGALRIFLGDRTGGERDLETARTLCVDDPVTEGIVAGYGADLVIAGLQVVDEHRLKDTAHILRTAIAFGDEYGVAIARWVHGTALFHRGGLQATQGALLLRHSRDAGFDIGGSQIDAALAADAFRAGRLTGDLIDLAVDAIDYEIANGDLMFPGHSTSLVVPLLGSTDRERAENLVDALTEVISALRQPVLDLWPLRCRLALAVASGDARRYQTTLTSYRALAQETGAAGHIDFLDGVDGRRTLRSEDFVNLGSTTSR